MNLGLYRKKISDWIPDPRVPILILLAGYLALGFTLLGFNRSPTQVLMTSITAISLEFLLVWWLKRKMEFPLSALITSLGLSILLNYSHNYFLLFFPVLFAIGAKHVFTFQGRHIYNPAMIGVVFSILFMNELITSAPAYQWNGLTSIAYFIAFPALMFFMPQINRGWLVGSFLVCFTLQIALRSWIMRYHLPFSTLFLGTLSSPAFLLFTFFMITDPRTSPPGKRDQIITGALLALLDLIFHIRKSYYTFFYASFTLATYKLLSLHAKEAIRSKNVFRYFRETFFSSGYYRQPLAVGALLLLAVIGLKAEFIPSASAGKLSWKFETIPNSQSKITADWGSIYDRLDPRVQHIAKWILSVGESVSVGDFDHDGLPDLFFSFPLKKDGQRAALYRNLGDFQFERFSIPFLDLYFADAEAHGLPTNGVFSDYDGDGDLDLLITVAFGRSVLLQNQLKQTGRVSFQDVSRSVGLETYTNSVSATFLDLNQDAKLDLLIGNVLPSHLPNYESPTLLNLFKLPEAAHEGDRRMFHFMHESWNEANNGGLNFLFLQNSEHLFLRQDEAQWGIPETRWTLALGTGDLNQDGLTDIYVANDFGPDDLYFNQRGQFLKNIKGRVFGSIGKDTYKGMNASIGDIDRNGWLDVYVSNVHHDMQAEGSLLWMFSSPPNPQGDPKIVDRATQLGALNERRFGWGAAMVDFNNDGWLDIAQANGMVDDSQDKISERCPDYWYTNEKLARSPPWIHSYADQWGDIRGYCIHGEEWDRLYLNRGNQSRPQFIDVAGVVGIKGPGNSRGMAAADLDNDGRLDLISTHLFKGPTIYQNTETLEGQSSRNHWIGFEIYGDGKNCNRDGLGTKLSIEVADGKLIREKQAADGFNAQNDRRIHFGLGAHASPVNVTIQWCGQTTEIFNSLPIDRYHRLEMGKK